MTERSAPLIRTKPSLKPDSGRLPRGKPESLPKSANLEDSDDVRLQNDAAVALAQAGYDVEYRHNQPITAMSTLR